MAMLIAGSSRGPPGGGRPPFKRDEPEAPRGSKIKIICDLCHKVFRSVEEGAMHHCIPKRRSLSKKRLPDRQKDEVKMVTSLRSKKHHRFGAEASNYYYRDKTQESSSEDLSADDRVDPEATTDDWSPPTDYSSDPEMTKLCQVCGLCKCRGQRERYKHSSGTGGECRCKRKTISFYQTPLSKDEAECLLKRRANAAKQERFAPKPLRLIQKKDIDDEVFLVGYEKRKGTNLGNHSDSSDDTDNEYYDQ